MKAAICASVLAASASTASAGSAATASPVTKVLELLSSLQSKVISEGEAAQKAYDEFAEWCDDRAKNVDYEIKTGKATVADLKASIEEETALASALNTKIEELAADIGTDEADLKAATQVRNKESADFGLEEKELVEVVDTLDRAVGILEREMQKGGASMVQVKNANNLAQALSALVQASVINAADSQRLTALVQSSQESDDADADADAVSDEMTGAPAAAVYKGQSGSIIDVLEDLHEKAENQLAEARKKEVTAKNNFEMLKQSLTDQVKFAKKDMAAAKKNLAGSAEKKAGAIGDLDITTKDLADDQKDLGTLHGDCMTSAQDFEAATKSRGAELSALAAAKKAISENTSGADSISYSFVQVSSVSDSGSKLASAADLANFEAVRFVRELARKQNSPQLAQLASRMASAMRLSSGEGSSDPFAKVKGLISDMIESLESSASADASHKAYCDKELAESTDKKEEKQNEIQKLTTKIDQMTARSAQLKEEVAALQKALAELAASQSEMDSMRRSEKAVFTHDKAEMEQGLEGIKMALKILREYYATGDKAHAAADGSSSGIVGLLEVVESDFSKGLAEITTTEDAAASSYDRETKENEITRATKSKDVEYKGKESVGLDKAVAEASSDRQGVQAELDAVLEYLGKLGDMCIAKAEPYSERKARREAEVEGLKEALKILEGEAVLLQGRRSMLRGVRPHSLV